MLEVVKWIVIVANPNCLQKVRELHFINREFFNQSKVLKHIGDEMSQSATVVGPNGEF